MSCRAPEVCPRPVPALLLALLAGCVPHAPAPTAPPPPPEGVAPAWSDWVSTSHAPEGFPARARAAVQACAPGVRVVDVDCTEPPCLVVARVDDLEWPFKLRACADWTTAYGPDLERTTGVADCGRGRQEVVALFGSPRVRQWLEDPAPDDPYNPRKRLEARRDTVLEAWTCGDGAAAARKGRVPPDGLAPSWTADVPPHLHEDFEGTVRGLLTTCGVGARLRGVDCGEPPCLAVLEPQRKDWQRRLLACAGWQAAYGESVSLSTDVADCDGVQTRLTLLGSDATWAFVTPPDDPDGWNGARRLRVRTERVRASLGCR